MKTTQILRKIIQIIFLIIWIDSMALVFLGIESIVQLISGKHVSNSTIMPAVFLIAISFIITAVFGRFFCGWICSFGTVQDAAFFVRKIFTRKKYQMNKKLDKILKLLKLPILLIIIIVSWLLSSTIFSSASPWDALGQIQYIKVVFTTFLAAFIFLFIIFVASIFVERIFCRYICPLAIFWWLSKFRIAKITKPRENCGKCRICTKTCPMGIDLSKDDVVKSVECINCMECVSVCPRKNVSFQVSGHKINAVKVGAIASIAFFITMQGRNYIQTATISKYNIHLSNKTSLKSLTGSSILSLNGNSVSQNSNSSAGQNVFSSNNISNGGANNSNVSNRNSNTDNLSSSTTVNSQNTNSTASSYINNNSSINVSNKTTSQNTSKVNSSKAVSSILLIYKNGTFSGTATGYRPGLSLNITLNNDRITNIVITTINDTPNFYAEPVQIIPSEIISAQSTNVDTVSGATFTSRGIIDAVNNALNSAKN